MTRIRSSKPELSMDLPVPALRPLPPQTLAGGHPIRVPLYRPPTMREAHDTYPVQTDVLERKSWSERWLDDLSHES